MNHNTLSSLGRNIPDPVLAVFRGIGQVFFQENALTGACFALGIAFSSPLMAVGSIVGSAIGTATARLMKFDRSEESAGIYGFNSALVGIAALFFFKPGALCIALLVVGSVAAALVTWLMRRYVPFPTYTTPFIVTTWALYFLGLALGAAPVDPGAPVTAGFVRAVAHGIGQVMFQASIWTALLFLIGIALNDWRHALWVVAASVVGTLVGVYHHDSSEEVARARDLRLQRDAGGDRPVSVEAIADSAAAGYLAFGAHHREFPDARAAGPDGALRVGDLVSPGPGLARSEALRIAGAVVALTESRCVPSP